MAKRIDLLDGSSVDPAVVAEVVERASGHERIMVVLDSYHTHEHVLAELRAYSPIVKQGGSLVVFGTSVSKVGSHIDLQRAWTNERNPKTALDEFLVENKRFVVDHGMSDKLVLTDAPGGYLSCIAD
jgi:cephalosporin hydroxylase